MFPPLFLLALTALISTASPVQGTLQLNFPEELAKLRNESSLPVLLFIFESASEASGESAGPLSDFQNACEALTGVVTCTSMPEASDTESPQPPKIGPRFELWLKEGRDEKFRAGGHWTTIVHRTKCALRPPITEISSKAQLQSLLAKNKPVLLGFFPNQSTVVGGPSYSRYLWWKSVTQSVHRQVMCLEVTDPELLPLVPKDLDLPFVLLGTSHWEERVLPETAYEQPASEVAEWIIERSWGFARELTRENLALFVEERKPLFIVWVEDFSDANKEFIDLAHQISFHFFDFLTVGVSSVSLANTVDTDGQAPIYDISLTYFGIARQKLPLFTILERGTEAVNRYFFPAKESLTLAALSKWAAAFLSRKLQPTVLSQTLPGHSGSPIVVLNYETWHSTIEERHDNKCWIVVFWTSQHLEDTRSQLAKFETAGELLQQIHLVEHLKIGTYDLILNDLPPGYSPFPDLITPLLYLPKQGASVILRFPSDWSTMLPSAILDWTTAQIAEHHGIEFVRDENQVENQLEIF